MTQQHDDGPGLLQADTPAQADTVATILERLGIGYFRIEHASGTLLRASEAFARMFGFASVDAALGVRVGQHYADPKERDEASARIYGHPDLAKTGVIRFEAQRLRHDTGEPIDVLMSLVPTFRDGKVVYVDGLMESIGDRKRAEKAFKTSEERFRILFETSATGMALASPEGRLARVNGAFCRLIGATEAEVVGQDVLALVHPMDRDEATRWRGPPEGASPAETPAVEWRFLRTDGQVAWGEVSRSWLCEDGKAHTQVLVVTDVTHRRALQHAMVQLEKLQVVAALSTGIAQDFNDLLTAVLGNVALARLQHDAPPKVRERLEQAELAVLRARDLTQQLVTLAHAAEPVRRPVDLEVQLRQTVDHGLSGPAPVLDLTVEPGLWRAHVDPGEMAQVLQTLLQRAAEIGQSLPIAVSLAHEDVLEASPLGLAPGRYLRLEVVDDGPRVADEDLTRLFDVYALREIGCSGLALPVVQAIVQRHGGLAYGRAGQGRGTIVTVLVPATELPAPTPATWPTVTRSEHEGPPRSLVLDDEAAVRDVAAGALRMLGHEVTTVADGDAAVSAYRLALERREPFDLVLIDLHLAGGAQGLHVLRQLQAVAPGLPVPALVSSGDLLHPVMADPEAHGFVAVMPKPYTWEQLRAAVGVALRIGPTLLQEGASEIARA